MVDQRRPDLVLVMTDQQRHDHVGWFPGSPARTPTLDRLAADGVVFDHCYSASSTCVPARTALMTGVLDHRVPTVAGHALRPGAFSLPRALKELGYHSALIGKMHFTPMRADHGFDHQEVAEHFSAYPGDPADWPELDHYHDWLAARGLADWRYEVPGGDVAPYPFPAETHPTSWVRDRTLEHLASRDRSVPLLLVVSFPHPHPAINPPEPYASMFDPTTITVDPDGAERNRRLPNVFREATAQESHPERRVRADKLDRHRLEVARTLGLVTQIDDAVAAILDALDMDRTVLWFTSDHGDYGTNRGLVRKVPWIPFDDLARVPCFATGGPVQGGRRFSEVVQSFDVATTFLDLAGWFEAHPEARGAFDGVSQQAVLEDPTATPDAQRTVWCALSSEWPMVRRGPHKYVRAAGWGAEVLFDVVTDPAETIDLARHPYGVELTRELAAAVDEQLARPAAVLPAV